MDDKELNKILQDKDELKNAYDILKNEKIIKKAKISTSNSCEGIFLTNVNKKFQKKSNSKNKLMPIRKFIKNPININSYTNKLIRSSSQPKYKLNPITNKRNNSKILTKSKSQNVIEKAKS